MALRFLPSGDDLNHRAWLLWIWGCKLQRKRKKIRFEKTILVILLAACRFVSLFGLFAVCQTYSYNVSVYGSTAASTCRSLRSLQWVQGLQPPNFINPQFFLEFGISQTFSMRQGDASIDCRALGHCLGMADGRAFEEKGQSLRTLPINVFLVWNGLDCILNVSSQDWGETDAVGLSCNSVIKDKYRRVGGIKLSPALLLWLSSNISTLAGWHHDAHEQQLGKVLWSQRDNTVPTTHYTYQDVCGRLRVQSW